ncbi:MAG: sigma 54-interacting transcriptional regulator [Bacteroidales bacterium]|nr:sigma 54-interacting transcriptional regulator [Bacteroidales bacterium]
MDIYITWHYTTHGIAYLKHVLSCFYEKNTTDARILEGEKYEQDYCNHIFDNKVGNKKFDKVYYLVTKQAVINKVSSRLHYHNLSFENDEVLQEKKLVELYDIIRDNNEISYDADKELQFVKDNFPNQYSDFKQYMWRDIQHYEVNEQIKWFEKYTNFYNVYDKGQFEVIELDIKNLRDEREIADNIRGFLSKNIKPDDNCVINISLGGPEPQSVWHILAANDLLPKNTQFIKTYDNKEETSKHFKSFTIKTVSTKLIDDISSQLQFYPHTKSKKRELVNKKIKVFINSCFSVLVLGERGTGKSFTINKLIEDKEIRISGQLREANCASFTDSQIAESELFGYKIGAFTGANRDKIGLIQEAEQGVLFLDEFHHLDKLTQAKLMKSFQTDKRNNFKIRRVGDNEETVVQNVKLVFATNRTIEELHEILLPDFYDRVVQYVVEIPPVRETLEDLQDDWKSIFERLYPNGKVNAPIDNNLFKWLKSLPLEGNFRDLENIAKDYKIFLDFDSRTQQEICSEMKIPVSAFEYAKKCYELYHFNPVPSEMLKVKIPQGYDAKSIEAVFHKELRKWAETKFGSRKEAAKQLDVSEKTLDNWSKGL